MKELSWKPMKRGNLYCSPACGRGCTRTEYESAVKLSCQLARRMGQGWKPHVWENLGWHGSAHDKTGCVTVHVHSDRGKKYYTAFLGEGGLGRWAEVGGSPERAVERVRQQGSRALCSLEKLMAAVFDV